MNKPDTDLPHPKMLLDPYAGWAANEGVPITEDFGVDLRTVPTAPWARFDTNGGIVHLKGRGDFVSIFVLPPSYHVLEHRLRGRSKDSEQAIGRRLQVARDEVSAFKEYDYVVINDEFDPCVDRLRGIVMAERAKLDCMRAQADKILRTFDL